MNLNARITRAPVIRYLISTYAGNPVSSGFVALLR